MASRDIGSAIVDEGEYPGMVAKIEDDQIELKNGPDKGEIRDVCRWFFLIEDDNEGILEIEQLSGRSFGPRSKAGKWARDILSVTNLPPEFDDGELLCQPILIGLSIETRNGYKNNVIESIEQPAASSGEVFRRLRSKIGEAIELEDTEDSQIKAAQQRIGTLAGSHEEAPF